MHSGKNMDWLSSTQTLNKTDLNLNDTFIYRLNQFSCRLELTYSFNQEKDKMKINLSARTLKMPVSLIRFQKDIQFEDLTAGTSVR